jgi:ribonuclease-3
MLFTWFKKFNSRPKNGGNFYLKIKDILQVEPENISLYELALVHSSASIEVKGQKLNNERLEFLGDSVLGAVITDYIYRKFPLKEEGELTNLRSKLVSRKHLNELGQTLGLAELLKFHPSRGTEAKSIYGDAFEALIGALYLDLGYEQCGRFLEKRILDKIDLKRLDERFTSHKSAVLEWGQKARQPIRFAVISSEGESHNPLYHVGCFKKQELLGTGSGASKKKAEEEAAKNAFKVLNLSYAET